MLAGLDQFDGAGFPPRAEQGSLSEILRAKMGALGCLGGARGI